MPSSRSYYSSHGLLSNSRSNENHYQSNSNDYHRNDNHYYTPKDSVSHETSYYSDEQYSGGFGRELPSFEMNFDDWSAGLPGLQEGSTSTRRYTFGRHGRKFALGEPRWQNYHQPEGYLYRKKKR